MKNKRDSYDICQRGILLLFKGGMLPKITSANIGRYLNIPKSTLSRIMQRMEGDGLLDRSDIYHPALTKKGSEIAEELQMCYEGTLHFLEVIGDESEETKKAAFSLTQVMTDRMMDKIQKYCFRRYFHEKAADNVILKGSQIAKYLPQGIYRVPYLFVRPKVKYRRFVSMANDAFGGMRLIIDGKNSRVILLTQETEQKSALTGLKMKGRPFNLRYKYNDKYYPCMLDRSRAVIPLSAFRVKNRRPDTEEGCYLASVIMRMECTVGRIHMPPSEAKLLIWL